MIFRASAVIPFRPRTDHRLQLPGKIAPEYRVAQISGGLELSAGKVFPRERWVELSAFRPEILVGYAYDLERLALAAAQETIDLGSVSRVIFVLTDCGTYPVRSETRDLLWRAFGVPVLELIIAAGSRLLAAECEVHDGWHMQPGSSANIVDGELICDVPPLRQSHTGFAGRIESDPCACGRPGARLFELRPRARKAPAKPAVRVLANPSTAEEEYSPDLLPAS